MPFDATQPVTVSRTPALPFGDFLRALLPALDGHGVRCCVLRNYEGFPEQNLGHDVDLLIRSADLPRAVAALRSVDGIRIVGATVRAGGPSLFLEGVSAEDGVRALQVDFITSLNWKGMPHLQTEAILEAAIPRHAGNMSFLVPAPAHEAIISLLSSLLVGGWVKEKYLPSVRQRFINDRAEVVAALRQNFGLKAAERLADAVESGERAQMLECVGLLRASLTLRAVGREPLGSCRSIIRHYAREAAIRYSPRTLETVTIVSLDGRRAFSLVDRLLPMLHSTAKAVAKRPLGPAFAADAAPAADGSFARLAGVLRRLAEEWRDQCAETKSLTLHLRARASRELPISELGKGEFGNWRLARLAAKVSPESELWILLDPSAAGLPSANPKPPRDEMARLREASRAFVMSQRRFVILDARRHDAELAEEAYAAIVEALARRADRELNKRI
jgi:hypothetical protein